MTEIKIQDIMNRSTSANTIMSSIATFAPEFGNMVAETLNQISKRETLDKKTQEMILLGSLVSTGAIPQVKVHIEIALNLGLTIEEIKAVFFHCIPICGFPNVTNALYAMYEVLNNRNK